MKKYKGFQLSWWLILLETVLMVLLQGILLYFLPYMNENLSILISQSVIIVPILLGILILKIYNPFDTVSNMLGIRSFDITFLIPLILMPVCSSFFISYITAPVSSVIYEIFGEYDSGFKTPENLVDFTYIFLYLCIIAPITEEILFRGIILKLLDRYGTIFTIIISSLAFAILHFNPTGFIPIFFLGIILALLKLGTGSIFAPVVFHAANNFLSFMILIFEKTITVPEYTAIIFSVCAAALFPVLLFIFFKFYCNKFYFIGTGEKSGFSAALLITVLLYAAICISTAFLSV